MLCNWCHKVIPAGEELKEQDVGYAYLSLYEGTGGGESSFKSGGYYHSLCYYHKQLWNLKRERDKLWKGWFWLWILFAPVLIIILIMKKNQAEKLDKAIWKVEDIISREESKQ